MTYKRLSDERVTQQYCIYWDPSDYPKKFVVRRWTIGNDGIPAPDEECKVFTRLTGARQSIPGGFTRIGRDKNDDKAIVEAWI